MQCKEKKVSSVCSKLYWCLVNQSFILLFNFFLFFLRKKMHVSTFSPNSGFIEHLNKSDHRYNKQWWPIINFVFSGQVVNWPCVRCSSFWGIAKAFSNTIISNKLFFPCIQHARRASLLVKNTTLPDNICSHIYCLLVN